LRVGKSYLLLRESRASNTYSCAICSAVILRRRRYFRDEPHPYARMYRGEEVRHLCVGCVEGLEAKNVPLQKRFLQSRRPNEEVQLTLPLGEAIVRRTIVRLIGVTRRLEPQLLTDEALHHFLYGLHPEEFEELVLDRFLAMGMEAKRVGHSRAKDGGVDIVFWPGTSTPVPYLGAVQVKHTRSPVKKIGPEVVRGLSGVLHNQPFHIGMIVTNTSFTPDAQWFAQQQRSLIRLRDMRDLTRWIASEFTDEAEWREMPHKMELCPGVTIDLPYSFGRAPKTP
jgi:hypothetical protein